ncbi:MAG: hypothetical protein Q8M76_19010 [Spirochaetaceae bacterium]|nr:hypothetical protein [Spirochaetaceae bacterium]
MRSLKRLPLVVLAIALATLVIALVLLQGGSVEPFPLVPLGQALIAAAAALTAIEIRGTATHTLRRPSARSPPLPL